MLRVGTKEYLTISEAAAMLGVNKLTLRRYTDKGFLPKRRNSLNNYRLYLESDIAALLKGMRATERQDGYDLR